MFKKLNYQTSFHASFDFGHSLRYHVTFEKSRIHSDKAMAYDKLIKIFPELKGLKPISVQIYKIEDGEEEVLFRR